MTDTAEITEAETIEQARSFVRSEGQNRYAIVERSGAVLERHGTRAAALAKAIRLVKSGRLS